MTFEAAVAEDLRVCLGCARVVKELTRIAVSTVASSIELLRCRRCIDEWRRRDALVIVEELDS